MMHSYSGMDKIKAAGWHLLIARNFPADVMVDVAQACRCDNVRGQFKRINASKYARVFRCSIAFGQRPALMYFKQYLYRSTTDVLKHIIRPSRAKRSLQATELLKRHDLNAPEVIAMGERKLGLITLDSFTFTHAVTDAPDIYHYCKSFHSADADMSARKQFVEHLGRTIGRMHAANISHGDLRPGNVLARKTDAGYEFFFLDNERTRKHRRIPRKLILKNLVQINMLHSHQASVCDRMRFYRAYIKENRALAGEAKEVAQRVALRTAERLAKKKHSS